MQEEIWVQIPTKSGRYYFSNLGRAKRLAYNQVHKAGGVQYHPELMLKILPLSSAVVSIEGKSKSLARLVAEAFVPNPNGYNIVYHKDGNKLNCRADNLEWGKPQRVVLDEANQGENEQSYVLRLYDITRDGRIFRKKDGKELVASKGKKGYLAIRLKVPGYSHCRDGRKAYKVHRLVAMKYLGNYSESLQVNHINGDKTDNRVENLEMVTNQENVLHAYRQLDSTERRRRVGEKSAERGKPVKCVQTGKIYKTTIEAARQIKVPASAIYDNVTRNKNPKSLNGLSFIRINHGTY